MNDKALQDIVTAAVERLSEGAPVGVALHQGVVTLTGAVQNDLRRVMIEQELLQIPDVLDVRNHLHVATPAGDVRTQLLTLMDREDISPAGMKIEEKEGRVTLTGEARSWFERDAVERLAWTLPGVRQVDNRLTLPPGAVEPDKDSAGNPLA